VVPELPSNDHTPDTEDSDTQVARPVASDDRTLFTPGDPPVILTCPTTSSLAPGEIVPIPTLVPLSKSCDGYIPTPHGQNFDK
jgi:hypothetical protein